MMQWKNGETGTHQLCSICCWELLKKLRGWWLTKRRKIIWRSETVQICCQRAPKIPFMNSMSRDHRPVHVLLTRFYLDFIQIRFRIKSGYNLNKNEFLKNLDKKDTSYETQGCFHWIFILFLFFWKKKSNQNGRLRKSSFSTSANSQYFFEKISWIG